MLTAHVVSEIHDADDQGTALVGQKGFGSVLRAICNAFPRLLPLADPSATLTCGHCQEAENRSACALHPVQANDADVYDEEPPLPSSDAALANILLLMSCQCQALPEMLMCGGDGLLMSNLVPDSEAPQCLPQPQASATRLFRFCLIENNDDLVEWRVR